MAYGFDVCNRFSSKMFCMLKCITYDSVVKAFSNFQFNLTTLLQGPLNMTKNGRISNNFQTALKPKGFSELWTKNFKYTHPS